MDGPVKDSKPRTRRTTRAPGEIIVAALLAIGAVAESRHERRHRRRAWLAAVPIVAVNTAAFYGQFSYFQSHRHPLPDVVVPVAVSVLISAALESIAVYFAWLAHLAQRDDDSAFRLRFTAYTIALGIAALNYSHFAGPGWKPNAWAVVFALASVMSPAMWSAYTRRVSRSELKAKGSIEDHAVRLGGSRWGWHPWLSAKVQSRSAWTGERNVARAIALIPRPKWLPPEPGDPSVIRPADPVADPVIRITATPPPASSRQPRGAPVPRAVRGPAAARVDLEEELIQWLLSLDPDQWPSRNSFAEDPRMAQSGAVATRRRTAKRITEAARERLLVMSNGAGHGDGRA